jgi:hypothetical protein
VHYRLIAEAIAALVPGRVARVLDYGCGEALHADRVAAMASEVLLCGAAPHVRAGIAVRFAKNAKIRAVAPDEVGRLPEHSLEQYLEPEDAAALFAQFHRLLKIDGLLVVSDIHFAACRGPNRRLRAPAVRRPERISHRRRCRARAHVHVRLLAPAHTLRTDPVRRSGDVGKAENRRIYITARQQKHRPQPGTRGILCATALRTIHPAFVACDTGSAQLGVSADVR